MVHLVINERPKRISAWFPSVAVLRSPVSGTWKTVAPKCRLHKRTSRWRGWNWYSTVLLCTPPSSGSRNFPCKITAKISLSERLLVICPGIMKLSGDKPASKRQRNRATETEREEGWREKERTLKESGRITRSPTKWENLPAVLQAARKPQNSSAALEISFS